MTYTETFPSQWASLCIRERVENLLKQWTPLFVEDGLHRKWVTFGTDSVLYIPSNSCEHVFQRDKIFVFTFLGVALRGDPLIWMFGVDDDKKDPEYLCEDWIPEINPQWTYYDQSLKNWV